MSKEVKAWMDSMGAYHETEAGADERDAGIKLGRIGFHFDVTKIANNIDTLNEIAELVNKHNGGSDE